MALSPDPRKRARQLANLTPGPGPIAPKGNQRARQHGGYSMVTAERMETKTRELMEAMGDDLPLRGWDGGVPTEDQARLSLAARAMARLEDVERYHAEFGWRNEKTGDPRASIELERKLRQEVADHLDALGCSPRSRAKLGLDLARSVSLADAMSEPDPARRRELLRQAGIVDGTES